MTTRTPLQVGGVRQAIPIDPFKPPHAFQPLGGVAVIADNTWAAFQGRKKLKIEWDNGPNASYNSAEYRKQFLATARTARQGDSQRGQRGRRIRQRRQGHGGRLLRSASCPRLHGAAGRRGRISRRQGHRVGSHAESAGGAGHGRRGSRHPKENVICHVTLLGGGFGRKSKPDYCAEAAMLSQKAGRR